jgi:hypothetical protein
MILSAPRLYVSVFGTNPCVEKFGFTFAHILVCPKERIKCFRGKTEAQNIVKEIKQYQKKWLQHVQRVDTDRIRKQALQYRRRNVGRPKKRWRDQLHLED